MSGLETDPYLIESDEEMQDHSSMPSTATPALSVVDEASSPQVMMKDESDDDVVMLEWHEKRTVNQSKLPTLLQPPTTQPDNSIAELNQLTEEVNLEDLRTAITGKRRGRKPGLQQGTKRKAPEEYSSNAFSVKSRKRQQVMSEPEKRLERAKNSDRAAKKRALDGLKKEAIWQNATESERTVLEQFAVRNSLQERFRLGLSAAYLKSQYEEQLAVLSLEQAKLDEEFWEDIGFNTEDEDDYCEDSDGDEVQSNTSGVGQAEEITTILSHVKEDAKQFGNAVDTFSRKAFQNTWRERFQQVQQKKRFLHVQLGPMIYEDAFGNVIRENDRWKAKQFEHCQPHHFFSKELRAVLRNEWGRSTKEWYTLPGPAQWWPDDARYYRRWGFDVSSSAQVKYLKAYQFVTAQKPSNLPQDWISAVHRDDKLICL